MQTTQALDSSIQNQFNSLTERFVQMEDALSSKLADRKPHLPVGPPEHTQAAEPISVKDIGDMLQQIRDHIVASPTQSISGPVTGQGTTDGLLNSQVEPPRVDQQMMNSLDRLCRLIDEKRRTIDAYSEDDELAESIMEDLQQIVNSLQQHGAPVERSEDGLLETKELELVSFRNGLRRFARGFGGGILEINGRSIYLQDLASTRASLTLNVPQITEKQNIHLVQESNSLEHWITQTLASGSSVF